MSYHYGGDLPGMAGKYHYGTGGLGVLGSMVPSTGTHGAGYGYASLSLPADANKEYLFPISAIPAGLTIEATEDSGFAASATNDGTYVVPFDVVETGVNIGSSSFTLVFGAPAVNLVGSPCTQAATSSTGAITVTPPVAGVVNLAGSNCVQAATSSTGAVTVTPRTPGVINLAGSNCVQASRCSVGAITVSSSAGGSILINAALVSASRTVNFQGGSHVVNFGTESQNAGSAADDESYFTDGQWWMDVDPDDRNFVVFNVTRDLADRATTIAAGATSVELILNGVTLLEGPDPQGAFIVALLTIDKAANVPKPSCTARVSCANGERFDRTMNFNLKEH